jgi:tetratricopeptide (TPR) repeat protein
MRIYVFNFRTVVILLSLIVCLASPDATAQKDAGRKLLRTASELAGAGKYPGALRIFEQVRRDYPGSIEPLDGDMFATLYGVLEDKAGHLEHSRWMLNRFPNPERVENAERTAKACILVGGIGDNALLEHAARLTRYAATEGTGEFAPWFHVAHGLSEYRLKNYEAALPWFEKTIANEEMMIRSLALAYYALALHHLDRPEDAQRALDKARALDYKMPGVGSRPFAREWANVLAFQIGLREAEASIQPAK